MPTKLEIIMYTWFQPLNKKIYNTLQKSFCVDNLQYVHKTNNLPNWTACMLLPVFCKNNICVTSKLDHRSILFVYAISLMCGKQNIMLMRTDWIQASCSSNLVASLRSNLFATQNIIPVKKNKQIFAVLNSRRCLNLFLEHYQAFKGLMLQISRYGKRDFVQTQGSR